MMSYLCVTIRFLQPYYHGRGDDAEPEWPPSPLRLFQAIVAVAAQRWRDATFQDNIAPALRWFEQLPVHSIISVSAEPAKRKYRLYVPDNVADKVAASWRGGHEASIADYRTDKDVCPMVLSSGAVYYLYRLLDSDSPHLQTLIMATRSVTHLGWGVDMVVADASVLSERQAAALPGERWSPAADSGRTVLRIPIAGTLNCLIAKHRSFLNRIGRDAKGTESFNPVPPLSTFSVMRYSRATDPVARPYVIFELRRDDWNYFAYPQDKLIHIAGMVRHLSITTMQKDSPEGVETDWVSRYVAGHICDDAADHRQFSYLPLLSIGHQHADQKVRRVMITAQPGDDRLLQHLARRLNGQRLKPTDQTQLNHPPIMERVNHDNVARFYARSGNVWASVTPVILPGHDDHKPDKTRKLIEKALAQSGFIQQCKFEWSAFSQFPKSLSAHKYGRERQPVGYVRPSHLLTQTAVHLRLRFHDGLRVPGPLAIGAGRHCGLGVLAPVDEDQE